MITSSSQATDLIPNIESNIVKPINKSIVNDVTEVDSNTSLRRKLLSTNKSKQQNNQRGKPVENPRKSKTQRSKSVDPMWGTSELLLPIRHESLCSTTYTKPRLMLTFQGEFESQPVRILVDSGSTVDLVSDKITLPQSLPYDLERMVLTTGGGKIRQVAKVFPRRPITVQGNSVKRKLTQVNLGELPFDIILGMPFLYDVDPIARWRLGALRFKKFTWYADRTLLKNIHTVNAITVAQDIVKYKKSKLEDDRVEIYIVSTTMIPPDDEELENSISAKLTSSQRADMKKLIRKYKHRDSIGSEKDNLPHLSEMRKKPKHWHMQIELNPSVDKEPHSRPRPMSPEEMKELKRQLTFLL